MKVMTINCVYQIGSTGKIIEVIAERLSDRCEFYFCYEKDVSRQQIIVIESHTNGSICFIIYFPD